VGRKRRKRSDSMAKRLVDSLREAGYRLTAPRLAIIKVLEAETGHLSPAEVLEKGRAFYPALSRATVYRTLDLLTKLGLLRPIYLGEGNLCFIYPREGHHHLICSRCGMVVDFDECIAAPLGQALSERFGFRIESHLLEFYGLCENCQKDEQKQAGGD